MEQPVALAFEIVESTRPTGFGLPVRYRPRRHRRVRI